MPWYAWVLVVWVGLSSFLTIAWIGKPREPITPPVAAIMVLLNALVIWAIIALAVR